MYKQYFEKLDPKEWLYVKSLYIPEEVTLDSVASKRLDKASAEFISFICSYADISNVTDTIWFLSYKDFEADRTDENRWWDKYERENKKQLSTEKEKQEYEIFWNTYLPFVVFLEEEQVAIAIAIDAANKGKIYRISAPNYKDVSLVANTLEEFIVLFVKDPYQFK